MPPHECPNILGNSAKVNTAICIKWFSAMAWHSKHRFPFCVPPVLLVVILQKYSNKKVTLLKNTFTSILVSKQHMVPLIQFSERSYCSLEEHREAALTGEPVSNIISFYRQE